MPETVRGEIIANLKRIVIKVGSGVISDHESGLPPLERGISKKRIQGYARRIRHIVDRGIEVLIVSSGSVMVGRKRLGLSERQLDIPKKQACAAIGQSYLMRTYEQYFEKQGLKVAQILLGHDDLENRKRFLNAKHTIEELLAHGVIPIINENDTVTVDEIKIGDNDTLSATVACLTESQLLIILSDVNGLYSEDPQKAIKANKPLPELLPWVKSISPEIEKLAGISKNPLSVGGMFTKVQAAKKTMSFGIPTLIMNGLKPQELDKMMQGKLIGTLFYSGKGKIKDRKHWIAHTLKPSGTLMIDAGAKRALIERNKSLLAAGIKKVEGQFKFGAAVRILDESKIEIARGLVNYSSNELEKIKGLRTTEVRKLVDTNFYKEVIHRDDLVLT